MYLRGHHVMIYVVQLLFKFHDSVFSLYPGGFFFFFLVSNFLHGWGQSKVGNNQMINYYDKQHVFGVICSQDIFVNGNSTVRMTFD